MSNDLKPTSHIAVSAMLRRGGMLPVPTTRDGLHVKKSLDSVVVISSISGETKEDKRLELELSEQAETLSKAAGYVTRRVNATYFHVLGKSTASI